MINGMREMAVVCDITAEGCGVKLHSVKPMVGMRVLVKPNGLEALSGVIRWAEKGRCGVQFDSPLYGPVVDHLCQLYIETGKQELGRARTRGLAGEL